MKARIILALGIMAALDVSGALAPTASQATEPCGGADTEETRPPQTDVRSDATGGGRTVFVDPKTRKIRQPDAAEIGRLLRPPVAKAVRRPALVTKTGPGGAVGVVLDDRFDSYTIVTRKPDGTLALSCVTGGEKAAEAVSTGVKGARKDGAQGTLDVR